MSQQAQLKEKKIPFSAPDDWTLIQHIGQMQSTNPLRSIKELVDNSIDAFARVSSYCPKEGKIVKVEINKNGAQGYIKLIDNAVGWEADSVSGRPNFEFSVKHIGDSIKKYLKEYIRAREEGIAIGQYALGLLSFWALGARLTVFSRCRLPDRNIGSCSKMVWIRNVKEATITHDVSPPSELDKKSGCVVVVDGLEKSRMGLVTGNYLRKFLARSCRSRLMKTGVIVEVHYKGKRFIVRPVKYEGTPFPVKKHHIKGGFGSIELELYLFPTVESSEEFKVPIFTKGAKVYDDITQIDELNIYPWNAKKVYGQIDYPYGTITPSRNAFVNDAFFGAFIRAMKENTAKLSKQIEEIEARKSRRQRKKFYQAFQKTWREILKGLPEEWWRKKDKGVTPDRKKSEKPEVEPGPMYRLEISPENAQIQIKTVQSLTAKPFDTNGNLVREPDIVYYWKIEPSSLGQLKKDMYRTCILQAGKQEGIATLTVTAFQYVEESGKEKTIHKTASTNIWIVSERVKRPPRPPSGDNPPSLEEISLAEEIHSRYLPKTNVVQVNNEHKDYKAAKGKSIEALYKYINYCYCKEIAVDRWKNLVNDAHELSERITDLLAISDLALDWKTLAQKPRGRPPMKESVTKWKRRSSISAS